MGLKVLSYNIQNGGGRRLSAIAGVIHAERPDLVALQEATSRWNAFRLARKLDMRLTFARANGPFHIAFLSRLPAQSATNHRLPQLAKTLAEITVDWEGAPIQIFATHLAGGADPIHPADEIEAILAHLRSHATDRHLLLGDFNSLAPDDTLGDPPAGMQVMQSGAEADARRAIAQIQSAGYVDCYRALHDGPGFTYPVDAPWLRLDYIFATVQMAERLIRCEVIDTAQASDHLPLIAEFL